MDSIYEIARIVQAALASVLFQARVHNLMRLAVVYPYFQYQEACLVNTNVP